MRCKSILLATVIIVTVVSVSCSSNDEIKKVVEQKKEVADQQEYMDSLDDEEFMNALDEYEGNMDSLDDEYIDEIVDNEEFMENVVVSNGLKELSREEFITAYSPNAVKVVLDGKIKNIKNFEPTIRKEAEYFIENYEKFSSYEAHNIYKAIKIEILAEDMEMHVLFYYGETEQGNLIRFDGQDNSINIKNESHDEYTKKDEELWLLLNDLEKSLINKYK